MIDLRIAFVSPGFLCRSFSAYPNRGGIQSQIWGVARELSHRGHEVLVCDRFEEKRGRHEIDGVEFCNVRIPRLADRKWHEIPSRLWFSAKASQHIRNWGPDVVNVTERFSGAFIGRGVPIVFTAHNPDAMLHYRRFALSRHPANKVLFRLKHRLEEAIMRRSSATVALNSSHGAYLAGRDMPNVHIVPNGIDIGRYSNQGSSDFILYAGRFDFVKGIDRLLQAFHRLPHDRPNLHLVGEGPMKNEISEMIRQLDLEDEVVLHPWQSHSDLDRMFAQCLFFVLPSRFETFGIVLAEAMASGKACVAFEIPGPLDVINSGHDGILVKEQDPTALSVAFRHLLDHPEERERMGLNARKSAEARYSFRAVTDQYENVFHSAIAGVRT